jgi:hypothetical protein
MSEWGSRACGRPHGNAGTPFAMESVKGDKPMALDLSIKIRKKTSPGWF